jgi:hypothetical protein
MLPAARTFRFAAGFLRSNCGNGFLGKMEHRSVRRRSGALKQKRIFPLKMRKANAARIQIVPLQKRQLRRIRAAASFCICGG